MWKDIHKLKLNPKTQSIAILHTNSVIKCMKKNLLKELKPLTTEERLEVIEYLSESMAGNEILLTKEQRNLIKEREILYYSGKQKLYSWDEVTAAVKNET